MDERPARPWRGARSDGKRVRGVSAELRVRAWELRQNLTAAETLLWEQLRLRRLDGRRFRCQHTVGTFVLDFYCPEHRLVIEVDGGIHTVPDVAQHDTERQAYLELQGYRVLHFTNAEVLNELPAVLNPALPLDPKRGFCYDPDHSERGIFGTMNKPAATDRLTAPLPVSPSDDPFAYVHDPMVRGLLAEALGDSDKPVAAEAAAPPIPAFADEARGIRLYEGDSFDLLARARPESFDLIFADPPYFLSGGGITCQSGKMVSVNKGLWDTPTSFEEMHAFNREWLTLCRRALKPDGSLWVSGTLHNIFSVGYALQTLGFKILNDIAWYKVNPPPNLACRYFTHATETLLWARKTPQSRHTFHYADMKAENGGKQMQSLWSIQPPARWEKRHGKHPTQKPEALLERIVRAASRPGDLVLGPFCGSGTTGVACARLGRRFVGMDREGEYLTLARLRIEDETVRLQLTFTFAAPVSKSVEALEPSPQVSESDAISAPPWAELVMAALTDLGGEADLREINRVVGHSSRVRTCPTWPATVRRVVRQSKRFEPTARGRYRLRV